MTKYTGWLVAMVLVLASWGKVHPSLLSRSGPWAPLPTTVQGLAGPITVKLVADPKDEEGNELWGSWEQHIRTIEIDAAAPPEFQWHTLGHELCHATLGDSGAINLLDADEQEALCDAFGSARVQEMRAVQ